MLSANILDIKPGDHSVIIIDAAEAVSANSNPMLVVKAVPESKRTPHITDYIVWTDEFGWKIADFMISVGLPIEDGETAAIADPSVLIGRVCKARLDHRTTSQGNRRLTVVKWLPATCFGVNGKAEDNLN